ncbi:Guanine nucleotide-binding protein alpha-3 subunit [Aphelenchoides avenae]|nr:Guanine nucleotide-binding protein alpha-3 subunit [Aphelenchus avenae]
MGLCQSARAGPSAPPRWGVKSFAEFSISDLIDEDSPRVQSRISKKIDFMLTREKQIIDNSVKMLLLGPGESGKSTFLKQMKIIHLNGYNDDELMAQRPIIYRNLVQAMAQLITGVQILRFQQNAEFMELSKSFAALSAASLRDELSAKLYENLKRLWALPLIQEAYQHRSSFQLLDCTKEFLDDLDRLYDDDYCPSEEDVLSSRVITYGVNELCYTYNNRELRFIDVGGQKSERRKWVNVFAGVNATIFFAAISEFDQYMAEDGETNRLVDAIKLFNEVGNNPLFLKANLILFLNKKDLFAEKIKRVAIKTYFPSFKYKQDYKNASQYMIRKFEKQMKNPDRNIYTHLTCAKDTDQMKFLTDSITDMIIASLVKQFGQTERA